MAEAKFYVVYIERKSNVAYESVKEKMDLAVDWYRINEKLWILYTTSDEEKLYSRLAPFVEDSGYLFICKLNISKRQGWMDNGFWKWIRREKGT